MADDVENDDQWLYGDNPDANTAEEAPSDQNPENPENGSPELQPLEPAPINYPADQLQDEGPPGVENTPPEKENDSGDGDNEQEDGELRQNGEEEEDLEDDSDDDVNVVIGDIKATTTPYPQQVNIKRGGLTTTIGDKSKQIQQTGKFQVEEFDQVGSINGVPASDYNLDALEEKPWRKPGSDITDYFNYGFNEDTWKAYCERQKRIRVNESGVGIMPLNAIGLPRVPIIANDNSKYANQNYMQVGNIRPMVQTIAKADAPKMNTIQVMTADRREYSRKPGFPDMSMPPPGPYPEPFPQPEYGFNPEPEPFYGGYEPTQDSQWMEGGNPHWQPTEIKTLTGGSSPMRQSLGQPHGGRSPSRRSPSKERDRGERDRELSRSRSVRPRDHEREKSRRRERSRSRSKRHRSRSRSPGHRSHKKKKTRRHDDSD